MVTRHLAYPSLARYPSVVVVWPAVLFGCQGAYAYPKPPIRDGYIIAQFVWLVNGYLKIKQNVQLCRL